MLLDKMTFDKHKNALKRVYIVMVNMSDTLILLLLNGSISKAGIFSLSFNKAQF